jgi:hypothetical protein
MCLARAGRTAEARSILGELLHPPAGAYASSYFPALVLVYLGELEEALDWLERAAADRVPSLVWVGVRPAFDPLRDHRRFQGILDRLGLPAQRPSR